MDERARPVPERARGVNWAGWPARTLIALWLLWSAGYALLYFHAYFGNMLRYFLDLPGKAPGLWRCLDPLF